MHPGPRRFVLRAVPAAAMVIVIVHCDKPTAPANNGNTSGCNSAQDLNTCLPSWSKFSPQEDSESPTPTGATDTTKTATWNTVDSTTGQPVSIGNVTFKCTDSTYKFVDDPGKALSFSIDQTKIWPGALIQGKTHRDAKSLSDLQELPIKERAPENLSIDLNIPTSTATVSDPSASAVQSALSKLISAAPDSIATASKIDFAEDTYSSEQQAAESFRVSGRYLGFEATATGSVSKTTSTNTVIAKFTQEMYVAAIDQPATPAAFFSSAFDAAAYNSQADLGRIGADNPPLYVSRVGYGRMMVFSMTANASAKDIEGALSASYQSFLGNGGSVSVSAKDSTILRTSQIRLSQVGGDATHALNAIQSGNLADYFTGNAPITSAAPLWFELKTLTGETAIVSEPGTYTQQTCTPQLGSGAFVFQPQQVLNVPFASGTQRQVIKADVNGDGRMDLVFNERGGTPDVNQVDVAFANGDGTFTLAAPDASPAAAPPEGWSNYKMLAADVDGDGRSDLVWNALTDSSNVVYIAMSNGDGTFDWRPRWVHDTAGVWSGDSVVTGDVNGDGKTDLVWFYPCKVNGPCNIRLFVGLAQPDTTFLNANVPRNFTLNWYVPQHLTAEMANLDGAPGDELLLNSINDYNYFWSFTFSPTSDSTMNVSPQFFSYSNSGWGSYVSRVGDVDGQNGPDLVFFPMNSAGSSWQYIAFNQGSGVFQPGGASSTPTSIRISHALTGTPYLADFNNDGHADLLVNRLTADSNTVTLGLGAGPSSYFTFTDPVQSFPAPTGGWGAYTTLVGDVNGDGKADMVWVNTGATASVFVALAH